MSGTLLSQGAIEVGNIITNNGAIPTLSIGLFVNNHTPAWTDSNGSFTECTATGYGRQPMPNAYWTIVAGGTPPATATAVPALFTFTAGLGQSLYGWFLYDESTGLILAAEQFTAAYAIPSGGGSYVVVPQLNILPS
jgi:hypothetical protein